MNFLDRLTLSVVPLKAALRSLFVFKVSHTPRRLWNVLKILFSMGLSRLLKRPIVWGIPPIVMVEPTNICNLKCPMCPSGNGDMARPRGRLDMENFKRLMKDIGPDVYQIQFWNQGEPFLNRQFLDMVALAKTFGVMTQTSTNGHFIRSVDDARAVVESGLDLIIFSLDGTDAETYARYRVGGDFHLVMRALEYFSEAKRRLNSKRPLIELQFLIFKHNLNELTQIIEIAHRNQVERISFKTAQIYDDQQGFEFLPENEKLSRYQYDGQHFSLKSDLPNWCKRLWMNTTINWDGSVSPCCFDKDADYAMAHIFDRPLTLRQVFKNEKYTAFRRQVLSNRKEIEMCRNCTEGMKEPYARIVEMRDRVSIERFLREALQMQDKDAVKSE
ncbi:radical SAM/SPASM domain-containing protein [Calditrichota bacterium LG25]